ncbi:MAG: polyphenol oxidase family protein [Longimicrobiales bacterium]|nr:polyphenol oxidase family protein [Longimicrobiales bacterium]
MSNASRHMATFLSVREVTGPGFAALVHPEWAIAFPWLIQGTTTRVSGNDHPFDLGLFAKGSEPRSARGRWQTLRRYVGADSVVHAQQVHGADVRVCDASSPAECVDGPHLVAACDGHATGTPGVVVAVTVADCVPVFLVDPGRRAVAAVHAGWRGVAAGILERGMQVLHASFGSRPEDLHVHLGPAICGACYEVGPEVFEALDQSVPAGPTPIDLRRVLGERAALTGVRPATITVSEHCTSCTDSELFSHRAGDGGRQAGYIGVRR